MHVTRTLVTPSLALCVCVCVSSLSVCLSVYLSIFLSFCLLPIDDRVFMIVGGSVSH
eukprot:COSAG05_NODE_5217_length_1233_cov_2.580247_1_plen_56_part_10